MFFIYTFFFILKASATDETCFPVLPHLCLSTLSVAGKIISTSFFKLLEKRDRQSLLPWLLDCQCPSVIHKKNAGPYVDFFLVRVLKGINWEDRNRDMNESFNVFSSATHQKINKHPWVLTDVELKERELGWPPMEHVVVVCFFFNVCSPLIGDICCMG